MRFDVVTLFPEFFGSALVTGLLGRALREGRARVGFVDPRRFTEDKHRSVDAAPYGGGAGMLLRPEPMTAAIAAARSGGSGPVVLLGPAGRPLAQGDLDRWAAGEHLVLVCGRYEGFDDRIRAHVDDEVSLGDFVLTGGEYAALAIVDGVVRLRPGTLGNAGSAPADSFSDGLLEHPQYTRPERFDGRRVPEVLLGGDHGRIAAWRAAEQARRTRDRRPDLLAAAALSPAQRQALAERVDPPRGRLAVGLDVVGPGAVEALARLGHTYDLARVVVVGADAAEAVRGLGPLEGRGWPGPRAKDRPPPAHRSPTLVEAAPSWAALAADGVVAALDPGGFGTRWGLPVADPARLGADFTLCLGEGAEAVASVRLPPLRQATSWRGLDGVALAAISLDRVVGEGRGGFAPMFSLDRIGVGSEKPVLPGAPSGRSPKP